MRLEEENLMLQRQVQDLQNTLADVEQQHAQRCVIFYTKKNIN